MPTDTTTIDTSFTLCDEHTVKKLLKEDPQLLPNYPEEKAVNRGIDLAYGKEQISASVTSGILQGKSIPDIANDLQNRIETMNRNSAIRVARTACTEAENAGRLDSFLEAEGMGIDLQKQWMATSDNRTRPTHAEADGQTVDIDKPFEVGSDELMFPGDPSGSPAEIYNCRCTMVSVLKEEEEKPAEVEEEPEEESLIDKINEEDANRDYEPLIDIDDSQDYDTWYDKAVDDWSAVESKVTEAEDDILWNGYIGTSESFEINDLLRANPDLSIENILSGDQLKTAQTLEDLIHRNTLKSDTLLTRYVWNDDALMDLLGINEDAYKAIVGDLSTPNIKSGVLDDFIGTTYQENGFVSSSGNSRLNEWTFERNVRIDISAPEGTNAFVTDNVNESEVILDRGTKFVVTGFEKYVIDPNYPLESYGYGLAIKVRVIE